MQHRGHSGIQRKAIKLLTALYSIAAILLLSANASAYDINKKLAVGGVVAGAVQCQSLSNAADSSNTCKGAAPFQLEVSLRPTTADEFFSNLVLRLAMR